MADEEQIPDTEIPIKKTRKKKEMTPEMLEQLKLAREKAIQVKKAIKGDPEKRVEHYKEKMKKDLEKPKTKKELKKQAEEEFANSLLEKEKTKEEPLVLVEVELPTASEIAEEPKKELPEKSIFDEEPAVITAPTASGIAKEPKKPKKKPVVISESESSDSDTEIVYVKKKVNKKPIKKEWKKEIKDPEPISKSPYPPSLFGYERYDHQRFLPPSLIGGHNNLRRMF